MLTDNQAEIARALMNGRKIRLSKLTKRFYLTKENDEITFVHQRSVKEMILKGDLTYHRNDRYWDDYVLSDKATIKLQK